MNGRILRGMLLLDLEHCCREQSSGSPERGWSGFFVSGVSRIPERDKRGMQESRGNVG